MLPAGRSGNCGGTTLGCVAYEIDITGEDFDLLHQPVFCAKGAASSAQIVADPQLEGTPFLGTPAATLSQTMEKYSGSRRNPNPQSWAEGFLAMLQSDDF